MDFNEKVGQNKKLYAELNNLERLLDNKSMENNKCIAQIDDLANANSRLLSDKNNLEKNVI